MKRTLGVCYYPEHWPEDQWVEDAARMVTSGLTWVRIGEFAWSKLEPTPGDLQFEWLDRAIDVLGAAGLHVVLGTPTATPPPWMLDKYPDLMVAGPDGVSKNFTSRRHYCFSHQGYRREAVRITEIFAERYGKNPYVQAWQTDNEYGCHDTTLSYSPSVLHGFREWLAQKYQSLDALNRAWGNVFWSMEFTNFDQVQLPIRTVAQENPAHVMDFRRYSSEQVVDFNRAQVDIIRRHTDAPITHNYMGRITEFDHYQVGQDLDIASWDSYPIGFLSDRLEATPAHKQRFLRQGDPDFQAFHHDLYRAVGKGRWWVMEQQPGPVNWAPYNPAPLPGMMRLWAWEAFAHGAEAVCYFRWRQAPFAQEQMHAGLLRPDSADAPGLKEAAQVADELAQMPDVSPGAAKVGLVFDYASAWAWDIQPQGADFDYFRLVFAFYQSLRRAGLSVDILPPDATDLSGYRLVLAPGLMTLSDALRTAIAGCSATVIVGPRSNTKTQNFEIPVPLPPNLPGLNACITFTESLPPSERIPLSGGGHFLHWFEHLEGRAEVTETTPMGPAIMHHDKLQYLAGWPDDAAMDRILRQACTAEGIATTTLPDGLRIRDTESHRFYINYAPEAQQHDGHTVPAAGVHWLPLP